MQRAVTLFGELLDTPSLHLWKAFEKYLIKILGLIFNSIKCNLNFHTPSPAPQRWNDSYCSERLFRCFLRKTWGKKVEQAGSDRESSKRSEETMGVGASLSNKTTGGGDFLSSVNIYSLEKVTKVLQGATFWDLGVPLPNLILPNSLRKKKNVLRDISQRAIHSEPSCSTIDPHS